jgi:hypothetical protein
MKTRNKFSALCCAIACVSFAPLAIAANLPADWQHTQQFEFSAAGLVKISLPVDTLDAARPGLEDLRLYDDAGNEIPFVLERPTPSPKIVQPAKSFQVTLNPNNTVVTLETGLAQPLEAVTLESPAQNFIKAVRVETSDDGKTWKPLAQGQPIFRQYYGAANLKISFAPTAAKWLRLTIDDARTQPIPVTGAHVYAATAGSAPGEWMPVTISERDENPGETRLALNLGAANLDVAAIKFDTTEPLFMRQVTLAVPELMRLTTLANPQTSEDAIREQTIGQGAIYRVAVEGQPPSENLSVPLEKRVPSRELIVLIQNGDSPPLPISAVHIERRPVYLNFFAQRAGTFHLLTGNANCQPPHYDLATLNMNLNSFALATVKISPPADNPNFRAPEVLPGLEITGASLDIADWKYRKPVEISGPGAQQVEFDLDILAHAQPGFGDLRVMHGSNQVPYIIQRTSINRAISPSVTATNDAKNPRLSRWVIKLPRANLPLTRLTCVSQTPLFERSLTLYETLSNERGDKYNRQLGSATWRQMPGRKSKEFVLNFDAAPQGDTLFLETQNGDNPPISLEKFTVSYPVTRALFKAKAGDEIFLYYSNPRVGSPSYDLDLVANQLLTADKRTASLGDEQQLKKSSWRENEVPGKGGVVLWGILALVVVVLLVIISRLLPKAPPA